MGIIVTGAAGALGSAVAGYLEQSGQRVARILRQANGAGQFACADLGDTAKVAAAFTAAASWLGDVTALVNVAGGFTWEKIEGGKIETWQQMFASNLQTAVVASSAILPHLNAGGSIVNIGAASAEPAGVGMAAYAASKAGVARLTESLAAELRSRQIRVNAVLPSIIDTPRNRADMPKADHSQWTSPTAIAAVIGFLVSDQSRAVTGALIPVTGGN